jgi:LPS export ABC transporter protein LptC
VNNFFKHKISWAVLLLGCFFLVACENDEGEINRLLSKKIGQEEAKNIKLTFTVGGKTKAILTSPLMLRVQDTVPYIEFPKSLAVDFYNEGGIAESKMTALYARYKENQDVVFLKDSVKVESIGGKTLFCDELYWDRNRVGSEFHTDKPVRVRTQTHIIDGVGLEASQDFKNLVILKPTGMIKIPSSQFPM